MTRECVVDASWMRVDAMAWLWMGVPCGCYIDARWCGRGDGDEAAGGGPPRRAAGRSSTDRTRALNSVKRWI